MKANTLKKIDLNGRDFKGKDLSGIDLSYTDLRGLDFSGAILVGANLSYSMTGTGKKWKFSLRIILLLLVFLAIFTSTYSGAFVGGFSDRIESISGGLYVAIFTILLFSGFVSITILHGIGATLWLFAIVIVTFISINLALPDFNNSRIFAILMAMLLTVNIASGLIGAISVAAAKLISDRWISADILFVALASAILGGLAGIYELIDKPTLSWALAIIIPVSSSLISLAIYIGSKAVKGELKYKLIHDIAISITSKGGTNFQNADLTDANLAFANLHNSDFRGAILDRTCFRNSHNINKSRVEGTYLAKRVLQQVITSGIGKRQDFRGLSMQNINLQGADLSESNLMGVNLSGSNLISANLSRANLTEAQLYGTNLTGATLTRATIENWAISTDSILEDIKCDCIYMRLPTEDNPDPWRKPDNRSENFRSGDFKDFVSPIVTTLNLYRQQYVDPRCMAATFKSLDLYHHGMLNPTAAVLAFKELSEQYPQSEINIAALEGKGDDRVRLQATVSNKTDSSKLSKKYFDNYRSISALPQNDIQAILTEVAQKDERIYSLEALLRDAIKQPRFYVETYQNQGDLIMNQSKGNVSLSGVHGNVSGVVAAGEDQTFTGVAVGAISGSVTNTINQLAESSEPETLRLKELLAELQSVIEAEPELSEEDKVEALEQVQTLAEAGQNPEDGALQKSAKTAMKILKGTIAGVSETTKLVLEGTNLLTAVKALLIFL